MSNKEIKFDPADYDGMLKIMEQYGDSEFPFFGKNEFGEEVEISVFKDKIVTVTFQENGWSRKNIYYNDFTCEEIFEGKWI